MDKNNRLEMLYHDGIEFSGSQTQKNVDGTYKELYRAPWRRKQALPGGLDRMDDRGQEGGAKA